jgi:hypothetical protein
MDDSISRYQNIGNLTDATKHVMTNMEVLRKTQQIDVELQSAYIKPNKKYVCFAESHKFARTLGLKTRKEWRNYVKGGMADKPEKPAYVPAHPDGIYKVKGWQGWKYWLGTADRGLFQ